MNTFNSNPNDNNNQLTLDDPRLTALALGELNDAALMAEVEKSPDLKREFERIQRTAKALTGAFAEEAKEPAPANAEAAKDKRSAGEKAEKTKIVRFPLLRPSVYIPISGAAAVAILALGIRFYDGDGGRVKPLPTLSSEPGTSATKAVDAAPATETPPSPARANPPANATIVTPPESVASAAAATGNQPAAKTPAGESGTAVALTPGDEPLIYPPYEIANGGYTVADTLIGTKINADLSDVQFPATASAPAPAPDGSAPKMEVKSADPATSGATPQWMADIGATDSRSLLVYTTNTEVAGVPAAAPAVAPASASAPAKPKSGRPAPATSNAPGVTRQVAASPAPAPSVSQEEVYLMSPFEVSCEDYSEYSSTATLAGTMLRTDIRDKSSRASTRGNGKIQVPASSARSRVSLDSVIIPPIPYQPAPVEREQYDSIVENSFASPLTEALSTFSIDVDTASYANVRRMLNDGFLPPAGAVRIEEMVNYFSYNYAPPSDKSAPFSAHIEATSAPWAPTHEIVRIGLKGYEIPWSERPASNLVFLVDVSGSMSDANKLPLVREGLKMLVNQLDARDSVAIVTYAGYESLALPSTTANNRETILHAIDQLGAGGSTNGAGGIRLAYEQAKRHYLKDGVNRVILCTDGDFNVGTTSRSDLVDLISEEAQSGVFLSIYAYGTGNVQDSTMEQLADKGNGNYGYVDSEAEARRVFVKNASGNFMTIAKDVKIQVEFNPAYVQAYRLIGYENRKLEAQDFNDDKKDAGEIGAGHTVTALYEVIPVGVKWEAAASVDALKYQANPPKKEAAPSTSGEMLTVKIRYKAPDGDTSRKLEFPLAATSVVNWDKASADTRFAAAVALFGMELRKSPNAGNGTLEMARDIAGQALGAHPDDDRIEFLGLVRRAAELKAQEDAAKQAQPVNPPVPELPPSGAR